MGHPRVAARRDLLSREGNPRPSAGRPAANRECHRSERDGDGRRTMKHYVEGGTDAASMILFDPEALPDDYEKRCGSAFPALIEELQDSGSAYWLNTCSDGSYELLACEGEPLPSSLLHFASNPVVIERFRVPSGRVYFTGVEYAFRKDDSLLKKFPSMAGTFTIPPGVYRLTLFEMDYPEDYVEDQIRQQVPPRLYWWSQSMGCFVWPLLLALVVTVLLIFYLPWPAGLVYALPSSGALILLLWGLFRLKPYRQAQEARRRVERQYPGFVAELQYQGAIPEPSTEGRREC